VAIFVAAAALRLALVQSARFTGDEALDYQIGMGIAQGTNFPLLGPIVTSGPAHHPGPFLYWLTAFPQLVTRAPEASFLFFELLGAASVWMFWFALRRPFGEAPAAFAAALLALSPWSALFADRVWNPNAFLVVELLAFLAVVKLRDRPDSAWAAVVPPACLALPHLHMSAPVVWLALAPLAYGTIRRWNRRYLALGAVLAALLYVPYAIHEAQTGFGNTRAFAAQMLGGHKPAAVPGASLSTFVLGPIYMLRFLTLDVTYHELSGYWGGLNEAAAWHALWYGSAARPFHPLRLAALLASGVLLLLVAARITYAAVAGRRGNGARSPRQDGTPVGAFAVSALVAIVADVALLALTGKQVFAHYVTPVLPFVFVIFAAGARAAFADRRLRIALLALAAIVCVGGVEATLSISRRIDARNGLAIHRAVAERVRNDCAAAGRPLPACPARLDFGFMGSTYTHGIFARLGLATPIRWEATPSGFAYRLQKREDPPPFGAGTFLTTTIGPVKLYRLR
jgi:hypothetical protein